VFYHNAERLALDLKLNNTNYVSSANFSNSILVQKSEIIHLFLMQQFPFVYELLVSIMNYYFPFKRNIYTVYETILFWTSLDTK
jgi:hypothetical protein